MTRMKKKYLEEVAPALMEKFQYKSTMQIPKIDKIVVSVGCGDCKDNAKRHQGDLRHHRSARCCYRGEEVRCKLQAS